LRKNDKIGEKKEPKMLKELIYLGVGGALLAKEKVEEELSELVERGKVSREEAKNIIDKAVQKGQEEEEKLEKRIEESIRRVLEEMGVATRKDIEEMIEKLKKEAE
jgi:polyhydroxyalkanoate synthesis regulator phasin